jgi:hypothetical protein
MHDHEIKGVFRYQHWDRKGPKGLPDTPAQTYYIPMQYITGIEVSKSGELVTLWVVGQGARFINRSSTILRFFEEYMAYQDAHERGL